MNSNYIPDTRDELEKKLQIVSFLRQSENMNRERIKQADRIYSSYTNEYKPAKDSALITDLPSEKISRKKTYINSFLIRFLISFVIVAFLYYINKYENNTSCLNMEKQTLEWITRDYSNNIFDFMKGITYTSTYEKINVK